MALSVIVALVLTPALCATLLKPRPHGAEERPNRPFGLFNRGFDSASPMRWPAVRPMPNKLLLSRL
ncbi:efflux RND transporter permease subunit [Methylovirgula sp. HY1]|uniref:efflux RND transporter permease subunit n=1 Tax=Methylovirgula sp. HY1 TaxID=2822761 RepID=UPI00351D2023